VPEKIIFFNFYPMPDIYAEGGLSFSSGIIRRANQLVWGLKNIDTFGFEHIEVGNNAVEIIESIIDGISAFRDELISQLNWTHILPQRRGARNLPLRSGNT